MSRLSVRFLSPPFATTLYTASSFLTLPPSAALDISPVLFVRRLQKVGLPKSMVRRIMKLGEDTRNVSNEALIVVVKAR